MLLAVGALASSFGAGCRRSRLVPRGDGAAVVVMTEAPAENETDAALTEEHEPNDSPSRAEPLQLLGDPLAVAVRGRLGSRGDLDVFRLVIPGRLDLDAGIALARRLKVDLYPDEGVALSLQLLDQAGRTLVSSSAKPGERDGVPNWAAPPGSTFYLRVRPARGAAQAEAAYRLEARLLDFELGDELEPNQGAAQATELSAAHTRPEGAGLFGWPGDEDWYRLPLGGLPAGTVLDVELEPVEGVAASLTLLTGDGKKLATARSRSGRRLVLRNLALAGLAAPSAGEQGGPARPAGEVYLMVRAESGRHLERRYALRVRPEMQRPGTETEPNDAPDRASPVVEGTTLGFLGPADIDVFRFSPPAPAGLEIEVLPPRRVDLRLEVLLAGEGRLLGRQDAAGPGGPERLVLRASEPVLIRVSQGRGEPDLDESYQLRVTLGSGRDEAPAEPAPAGAAPEDPFR